MSWFSKKREPPLHLAVLEERYNDVAILSQNSAMQNSQNELGFTALEIAQFLGKKPAIDLLQPSHGPARKIKVVRKKDTTRLLYSFEDFAEVFDVIYLSHLRFESYHSFIETIHNCPWIIKSRLGAENQELGNRFRKQLSEGYVINSTIIWIDDLLGYGLFANENISPGEYVGEYTGLVRTLNRFKPDYNEYCFHYPTRFFSWKYYLIDGLKAGNELRYVNHSDRPNLQPVCLYDRGLLHQCFLARTPIRKGMQLTFDYGKDFWD